MAAPVACNDWGGQKRGGAESLVEGLSDCQWQTNDSKGTAMQHEAIHTEDVARFAGLARSVLLVVLAALTFVAHAQSDPAHSAVPEAVSRASMPYPDLWVRYYGEPFGLNEIVGGDYPGTVLPDGRRELFMEFVGRAPKPWIYPMKQIVGRTVFGNAPVQGSWVSEEKGPAGDIHRDIQTYRLDTGHLLELRPLWPRYRQLGKLADGSELVSPVDKQINLVDDRCEPVFNLLQYRSATGVPLWTRAILTSIEDENLSRCPAYTLIGGYKVKPISDNPAANVIELNDGTVLLHTGWTLVRLRLSTGYPDQPHPEVFIVDGDKVRTFKSRYVNSDFDEINAALRREFMNSKGLSSR
jgi:hypothetical protein